MRKPAPHRRSVLFVCFSGKPCQTVAKAEPSALWQAEGDQLKKEFEKRKMNPRESALGYTGAGRRFSGKDADGDWTDV